MAQTFTTMIGCDWKRNLGAAVHVTGCNGIRRDEGGDFDSGPRGSFDTLSEAVAEVFEVRVMGWGVKVCKCAKDSATANGESFDPDDFRALYGRDGMGVDDSRDENGDPTTDWRTAKQWRAAGVVT